MVLASPGARVLCALSGSASFLLEGMLMLYSLISRLRVICQSHSRLEVVHNLGDYEAASPDIFS